MVNGMVAWHASYDCMVIRVNMVTWGQTVAYGACQYISNKVKGE